MGDPQFNPGVVFGMFWMELVVIVVAWLAAYKSPKEWHSYPEGTDVARVKRRAFAFTVGIATIVLGGFVVLSFYDH